jgi:hypothetical protein
MSQLLTFYPSVGSCDKLIGAEGDIQELYHAQKKPKAPENTCELQCARIRRR